MADDYNDSDSALAPTSVRDNGGLGDLIAGVRNEGRAAGGSIRAAANAFSTGLGSLIGGGGGDPQAPGVSNNGADGSVIRYGSAGNPTAEQRAAGYGYAPDGGRGGQQDQQQDQQAPGGRQRAPQQGQQGQQDQQQQDQQAPASTFDPVGFLRPTPTPDGGQASTTITNSGQPVGDRKPDPAAGGYVPNRSTSRLDAMGFGRDQPLKAGGLLGALGLSDVAVGLGNLTNPAAIRDAIDKRNAIYQNAVAADEAERRSFLQGIGTRVQNGDWSALADAARIDPQGYQQLMSSEPMRAGFAGHVGELGVAAEYLAKVVNGNPPLDPERAASSAVEAAKRFNLSPEDQQHLRSLFGMSRAQMASMLPVVKDAVINGNAYQIDQNKRGLQTSGNTWLPATDDLKASAPPTKAVASTSAPGVAVNVAGPIMMPTDRQSAAVDGRRYLDTSAPWVTKGDPYTGAKWEEMRQQAEGFSHSPEARQVVALNSALNQYPDAKSFNALGANARNAMLGALGAAGLKTESEVSAASGIPAKIAAKLVGGVALSDEEFGTLQKMAGDRLHQVAATADPARSALITELARQGVSPADAAAFIPDIGQGVYASTKDNKGEDAVAWEAGQQQRKKWSKDFAKQYPDGYVETYSMKGDKPRAAPADPNDLDAYLSSHQQGATTAPAGGAPAGGSPTGGSPGPQNFAPSGGPGSSPGQAAIDKNMGPAGGVGPAPTASVAPVAALAQARAPYRQELQDPAVALRLLAITHAEVGGQGPDAQRAFIESVVNRAAARGQTLAQTLQGGYFPDVTYQRARAVMGDTTRLVAYGPALRDVMAGSNVSNFATGNASGSVGFAGGPRVSSYNGENFGIEGPDAKWSERMRAATPDTIPAGSSPAVTRKALGPLASPSPDRSVTEDRADRARRPAPASSNTPPTPNAGAGLPWGSAAADAFDAAGPANMPSTAGMTVQNDKNREAVDAFMRSGANAVTFGQADRLAALANSGAEMAGLPGLKVRGGDTVADQVRATDEAAREHPYASAAGGVAGTVMQAGALPARAFATGRSAIGTSALLGGLDAAGQEANRAADPLSWKSLKDVALGAGLGATAGSLAPVVGRAVGSGVIGGAVTGATVGGLGDVAAETVSGNGPSWSGLGEGAALGAATGGLGGAAGRAGARANERRLGIAPEAEKVAASTLRDAGVTDFRTLERLAVAGDPAARAAIEKNGLSLAVVSQAAQAEIASRGVRSGTLPPEAQTLGAVQKATAEEAPARYMAPEEATTAAAGRDLVDYGMRLHQRAAADYAELQGSAGSTFATPASAIFQQPIAPELAGLRDPRLNNSLRSPAGPALTPSTLADDVRRDLTLENYTDGRFPSVDHAVKAIDQQIGREGSATTYGQIEGLRQDLSAARRDASGQEARFLGKALDAFDESVERGIKAQFPDVVATTADGKPVTRGDQIVDQIRGARAKWAIAETAFGDEKPSRDLVGAIRTAKGASDAVDAVLEADPRAVPRFVAKLAASPDARMAAPDVIKAINAKALVAANDRTAPMELRQAAERVPDALRTAFVAEHFAPGGQPLPLKDLVARMKALESREYAPIRTALRLDGKPMAELRTLHLLAMSESRIADLPADTRARAQKVLDDFMPGVKLDPHATGAETVAGAIGGLLHHATFAHRALDFMAERSARARQAKIATPASVIEEANRARGAVTGGGFGEYAGRLLAPTLSHALVGAVVPPPASETAGESTPYVPQQFVSPRRQAAPSDGAATGYTPRQFVSPRRQQGQ